MTDTKICANCKYSHEDQFGILYCTRVILETDRIYGTHTYRCCAVERQRVGGGSCGPDATFYKKYKLLGIF